MESILKTTTVFEMVLSNVWSVMRLFKMGHGLVGEGDPIRECTCEILGKLIPGK